MRLQELKKQQIIGGEVRRPSPNGKEGNIVHRAEGVRPHQRNHLGDGIISTSDPGTN